MHAVIQWLRERLKLEISEKKTRIINVRNHYSDFLGFKMKVHRKGNKLVVISYIADKNFDHKRQKLKHRQNGLSIPEKSMENRAKSGSITVWSQECRIITALPPISTMIAQY